MGAFLLSTYAFLGLITLAFALYSWGQPRGGLLRRLIVCAVLVLCWPKLAYELLRE